MKLIFPLTTDQHIKAKYGQFLNAQNERKEREHDKAVHDQLMRNIRYGIVR